MDTAPHILVVDDDREIRELLSKFLVKHGMRVRTAADGREMAQVLEDWSIDLVVLDLMLPGDDGLTLCRNLRAGSDIPVIMLTAMGEETDRIVGLEMGADDYIAKPFNPRELLARVKAVLRRAGAPRAQPSDAADGDDDVVYTFDGWSFVPARRELRDPDGTLIALSGGEFDLLNVFVTHPGRVLSRDQLLDMARGREAVPFDRAMDVQVSRLRRKVEDDPAAPKRIATIRGGGYQFMAKVATGTGRGNGA